MVYILNQICSQSIENDKKEYWVNKYQWLFLNTIKAFHFNRTINDWALIESDKLFKESLDIF